MDCIRGEDNCAWSSSVEENGCIDSCWDDEDKAVGRGETDRSTDPTTSLATFVGEDVNVKAIFCGGLLAKGASRSVC